jgi:hypothetical protein
MKITIFLQHYFIWKVLQRRTVCQSPVLNESGEILPGSGEHRDDNWFGEFNLLSKAAIPNNDAICLISTYYGTYIMEKNSNQQSRDHNHSGEIGQLFLKLRNCFRG